MTRAERSLRQAFEMSRREQLVGLADAREAINRELRKPLLLDRRIKLMLNAKQVDAAIARLAR
jgi:hypothetical protein